MTEKYLETKLRDGVKKMGGLAIKFFATSFTGLPDRIVLMPGGKVSFAEIKKPGELPKPHQIAVSKILKKMGFEVWTIDSIELVNDFLNSRQ